MVCALAIIAWATPATAQPAVELPPPTGPAKLGTVTLHLIDSAREDPHTPGAAREVMAQLWYPSNDFDEYPAAPCLDPRVNDVFGLPSGCQTHAHVAAPVARRSKLFGVVPWPGQRSYPVVLFSHGHGSSRGLGTALIEELASRGYVVVAVDHPYDAGAVEFPDGRVVEFQPEGPLPGRPDLAWLDEINRQPVHLRAGDLRFTLNALALLNEGQNPDAAGRPLPEGLRGALDLSRVGVFGHSLGGSTAAQVMLDDPRVKAGFLLDGAVPPEVRASGLDKPVMFLGSEQPDPLRVIESSWQQTHQRGWHLGTRLTGSGHNTLTDLAIVCEQLDCGQARAALGSIDGERAVAVQRSYLAAFFGEHLLGRDSRLLDGPSRRYPEIVFLD